MTLKVTAFREKKDLYIYIYEKDIKKKRSTLKTLKQAL